MITARELKFHFSGKRIYRTAHLTAVLNPGTSAHEPVSASTTMLPELLEALQPEEPYFLERPETPQLPCRCYHPECRRHE